MILDIKHLRKEKRMKKLIFALFLVGGICITNAFTDDDILAPVREQEYQYGESVDSFQNYIDCVEKTAVQDMAIGAGVGGGVGTYVSPGVGTVAGMSIGAGAGVVEGTIRGFMTCTGDSD